MARSRQSPRILAESLGAGRRTAPRSPGRVVALTPWSFSRSSEAGLARLAPPYLKLTASYCITRAFGTPTHKSSSYRRESSLQAFSRRLYDTGRAVPSSCANRETLSSSISHRNASSLGSTRCAARFASTPAR